MQRTLLVILLLGSLGACRSRDPAADRTVYQLNHDVILHDPRATAGTVPRSASAVDAAPAGLTEAQRRAWFDLRRAERRDIPLADNGPLPPVRTRTIYVHDHASHAAWAVPLTLGIGYGLYRSGRHHRGRHHSSLWVDWWGGASYGHRW